MGFFEEAAVASLEATSRALLIAIAGVGLHRKNILTDSVRKSLSKLCKVCFLPCLLLARVPPCISPSLLLELWPLIVFSLIYSLLGALMAVSIGKALGRCQRWRGSGRRGDGAYGGDFESSPSSPSTSVFSSQQGFLAAASGFGNTTSLPLSITIALAMSYPALRAEGEDEQAIIQRGSTYVLIYTAFNSLWRWTIAYWLLSPPRSHLHAEPLSSDVASADEIGDGAISLHSATELTQTPSHIPSTGTPTPAAPDDDTPPLHVPPSPPPTSSCLSRVLKAINAPVIAAGIAIVIGLISPMKALLYDDDAPLRASLTGALFTLGEAYVPCMLLVLGSNVARGPGEAIEKKLVMVVVFCKMVILPTFGLFVVSSLHSAGLLADPVLRLVLCLESAGPPAISLSLMCNLHSYNEKKMGALLFYSYIISLATYTLWTAVFLHEVVVV